MIGEWFCFHLGLILLKRQSSGVYQMLDLLFKGQAAFGGVARGFPMVCAGLRQGYATLGKEAGRSSREIS